MDLGELGFWELIKLDFAIDIEFLSRYWILIILLVVLLVGLHIVFE